MNLSKTSQKLLAVFFRKPDQKLYINELIREVGLYPNSVFQSLRTLEKQHVLHSSREGQRKFYSLNKRYTYLPEIQKIVGGERLDSTSTEETKLDWVKILNRQTSYCFNVAMCVSNMKNLKNVYGVSVPTFWYNSVTRGSYYYKSELANVGKVISQKIRSDLHFAEQDIRLCRKACDNLVHVAQKIPLINLPKQDDKSLLTLLKDFYVHYLEVFPYITTPHAIDQSFEAIIRQEVDDEEVLTLLLSPVSVSDDEQTAALEIAVYAKKAGFDKHFHTLVERHWEQFRWLSFWNIEAEPMTIPYFENEVRNILDKVKDPAREMKRLHEEEAKARKTLIRTFHTIHASQKLQDEVKMLQEYISLRVYRKNAICQAHYSHMPLLFEAGRRFNLTSDEVTLLSHSEIMDGLSKQISQKTLKALVTGRQKGWAILMRKGSMQTITGVQGIIETMERYKIIAPTSAMQRTVKGNVASRGRVTGKVKIITKLSELSKINEGDVLVAKMTTPDYVMAMHKAAAIVTDEGGVTCHAAIVSREFNIPCIVGTKNATQILADDDVVEVDAMEGIVRVVEAVEAPEDIRIIPGKTIYKGKVRGVARIVLDAADFAKVQPGDILIAPQTTPEYLSSLYRVKGFIVDEDALTSHAVLYGKALRLPSIMGTVFAKKVIKDGDLIELDATHGVVRRIKMTPLP